jgi:hypothetical protein
MRVGVALLPITDDIVALVRAQSALAQIGSLSPALTPIRNLPHISLLQTEVPDNWDGADVVVKLAEALAIPIESLTSETVFVQKPDWLFLGIRKTQTLVELQQLACRLMQDWLHPPTALGPHFASYSNAEKKSYAAYGYRYIGEAFLPHVTLGRMPHSFVTFEAEGRRLLQIGEIPAHVKPGALTVYAVGANGAHADTLACASLDPKRSCAKGAHSTGFAQ